MKLTVYNVICHKEYEHDPDCNGSYSVTCASIKEAKKELRKCIAEDYDGYYCGNAEPSKAEMREIVENAVRDNLLVINDMTCTYVIDKQTVEVPLFVLTSVDHRETDDNCGVYVSVFQSKERAQKVLKASVNEEITNGTFDNAVYNHGFKDKDIFIAESPDSRFGWTIDEV